MTDYSTFASAQLNTRIAAQLGYTLVDDTRIIWRDPDGDEMLAPPDWTSSLDRAWKLFEEMGAFFTISTTGVVELWNCGDVEWSLTASTPAEAICLAWLWWKEQQDANEETR